MGKQWHIVEWFGGYWGQNTALQNIQTNTTFTGHIHNYNLLDKTINRLTKSLKSASSKIKYKNLQIAKSDIKIIKKNEFYAIIIYRFSKKARPPLPLIFIMAN